MADGSGASLTYAALNERANQMARCMAESGIGSASRRGSSHQHAGDGIVGDDLVGDDLVGLLLHRSVDMIAAMWAVLKVGAGFLPIDPGNPPERIAFLLADSGAAALITDGPFTFQQAQGRDRAAREDTLRVFRVDADKARFAGQGGHNLGVPIADSALAYVIYTSGSTGQPKGVLIEHGGLAQHIVDVTDRFGLSAHDKILQFAAYTFDQGLEQVFTALTVGGTLVVRGDEIWSPADFPQVIREYGLNVINLPPAYWNQVLQEWTSGAANKVDGAKDQPALEGQAERIPLHTIISGGDVLTPESLRLWQGTAAREARLINAYGPTETTITACAFDAPAHWFEQTSRAVPIGRPLANRLAYVVDRNGKPVPTGAPGELWLGGTGVARGYLNRDELTAEKFVPNPFVDENGSRVYRTGDLVRYRRDGNLEFMGRIDQQVKVRGFRIELGEIEAALMSHAGVRLAAVVVRGSGADKQLAAFVAPTADAAPLDSTADAAARHAAISGPALRSFLAEKLPGYMIPAAFVTLAALPTTASGKIDRAALRGPAMEAALAQSLAEITNAESYVAPRTPIETEIAQVWAEVLKAPRVGIYDNFFDLGGHSLLATQIVSRLRTHYPVDLPLRQLFEAPTVAGLARLIEDALLAQQSEDELAALLAELDGLTEEEARALLADGDDAAPAGNPATR